MRRLIRFVATFVSKFFLTVLRAIFIGVVLATFAMVMMHYAGLHVPGLSDLLDKLEGLGRSARILS